MKIAIAVHGRFFAFDLAKALIEAGHEVRVFTNYPKWAVRRFGLNASNVESFPSHGVLARLVHRLNRFCSVSLEGSVHRLFGRWAASRIMRERWDVVQAYSGIAEEIFRADLPAGTLKQLVRGSCHIAEQDRLLREEEVRCALPAQRPGAWSIAREEREYQLADSILVLSQFAYNSFLGQGVSPDRLAVLPLGVDTACFQASSSVVAARAQRIRAGNPIRVLTVGTLSPQKGLKDYFEIVQSLAGEPFLFRFVGDVPATAEAYIGELRRSIEMVGRQPQHQLPEWYAWGDIFLFPTIQDGFAVVLAQAQASGLLILTTTNCS
ncbi:MAG: glycosyltransferase family 4 protein, partial [Acidobacteriota bacterium]|nr:glycosyltransferase family 4 protein [Acidobacteriota bacterium]